MNKNSILAVVLSGLVLFAYIFVQTKFFSPVPQTAEENNVEQIEEENDSSAENVTLNDEVEFKVADENGQQKIAFAKRYKDYTLIKQYSFMPDDYMFKMNIIVDGEDGFDGISLNGTDGEKISYVLRTSPQIGPFYDPKSDRYENRSFIGHNGSKVKRIQLTENQNKKYGKDFIWAGIGGKYFCELVIPENPFTMQDVSYSTVKSNFSMADAQNFFERKEISDKRVNDSYYIYVGPRSEKELKKYSLAASNGWRFEGKKITDALVTSSFLGWLESIFKWMMQLIYKIIPNWGVSIIIMTIILKLILFPLTLKSSLGTLKMQEMQPRLLAIQNKYKDNPQKLQTETAKLYQEILLHSIFFLFQLFYLPLPY